MAYTDLTGDISVHEFRISYSVPSLSSDKQKVNITYKGIADPASTVILTKYKYSMDNGTTWEDMTPSSGTSLTGLSFTPSGSTLQFEWEAKQDIGNSLYNNSIKVLLQAYDAASMIVSNEAIYNLYFERVRTNLQAADSGAAFSDTYAGIPGNELLEKAPKPV